MAWLTALVVLAAVLTLVGHGLYRASLWAGDRGWIYNKHNPRPRGSGTLGLLEQIYQPGIEHVIDERSSEQTRAERDESGDKPEAGFSSADA